MSDWLTDSVLQWKCSNAVWAEPSADLLVRKLLGMQVKQEAEKLVAGNLKLFEKAQAMESIQQGSGTAFMEKTEKLTRKGLAHDEMKSKGAMYQMAVKRFEELRRQRDQELSNDANAYMNACGVCAGYTLMWLANAIQGQPRMKPEQRLAQESQGYLLTRWALANEFSRQSIGKAPDSATIYRKALKQMTLWKTTVVEAARGQWDWESPGLGTSSGSKVFVEGAGAKKVWAAVRDALKNGGGALLSITFTGSGGKNVGHAIAFYRERDGGALLAFDANFGLGLYQSEAAMPAAIEKKLL
jgi:hypothetical protein